jgi:hypothetical protein
LRDYFNPILAENEKYADDYKRFVLAMLLVWVESSESFILKHLVELSSTEKYAEIFVEYMRTQMSTLFPLIQ